jgi:hypothetical protein
MAALPSKTVVPGRLTDRPKMTHFSHYGSKKSPARAGSGAGLCTALREVY